MHTIVSLKTSMNSVLLEKDNVEIAKASRKVLRDAVEYIYEKLNVEMPTSASLLELIDNSVVKDYIDDRDVISALHYARTVGINAEHGEKIRPKEAKLARDNVCLLIELLESIENGNRSTYVKPPYMSEAETRKLYIDLYLREAGWEVLDTENLIIAGKAGIEIKVDGMPNPQGIGFCDYVLYGRDGKPLAIVEAKKTSVDPVKGRHQVDLYGDCMEAVYGYKPILYYTNGYETQIIDGTYPDRHVIAFHTIDELELMLQHRDRKDISVAKINDNITNRAYQKMAITNVCEWFNDKHRRGLLVMATGTGKTRVAISLVDILSKNQWIKNVLFLADRTALVSQAKKNFAKLLPDMSICELSGSGDKNYNARIMFSTYQTMINYIDAEDKIFTTGRFDLIIIDEAHRSIFNKYGSIFNYFDSLLVGLTATPKSEVDANTYRIFGCESGIPNFDYSLDDAVKDHYLVPYKAFSRTTKLLKDGIDYNSLTDEEKNQLQAYTASMPPQLDFIPSSVLFRILYNKDTCRKVIEEVMENGIKVESGEKLGKTIVFAYNHKHAEMIVECFQELYPKYGANYCQLIDNQVKYADDLIVKFGEQDDFRIAVSVDMLDTGIDVPEVVNLVFFKQVKSKIKFVQMIGRGTRLCSDLFGPGKDKEHFVIFDYCGNFEYFEQNPEGATTSTSRSLSQRFFEIRVEILHELQAIQYQQDQFAKSYYDSLKIKLHNEVLKIKENSLRIQVREQMSYVDKYCDMDNWTSLSPLSVQEIKMHLAKLVDKGQEGDRLALAFDIRMLAIELSLLVRGSIASATTDVKIVRAVAQYLLTEKASVPQVLAKASNLKLLVSDQFWSSPTLKSLEDLREDLRDLMQFISKDGLAKLEIDIPDETEGGALSSGGTSIDIRTYRQKVIDYLLEHSDSEVINKIKNIEPIDADDLKELERVLWEELGTKDEYDNTTDIGNLAAFVRSLIGLDQDVINEKFGAFLSENTLNSQQQEFIKTIIDYVRENGDISKEDLVEKSPFDNYDIMTLFGENLGIVINIVETLHKSINVAA